MNHNGKETKSRSEFEFCEVCRLNHNHGRRHNYLPNHKKSLSSLLARFQSKLTEVKFFLKTPNLILPEHAHQNRLWRVFCNCDILELGSKFACSNTIEHLASEEHWKREKGFMWKYGGGMDRVDLFRIVKGRGRPKKSWIKMIEKDMRFLGIGESMAMERQMWRERMPTTNHFGTKA